MLHSCHVAGPPCPYRGDIAQGVERGGVPQGVGAPVRDDDGHALVGCEPPQQVVLGELQGLPGVGAPSDPLQVLDCPASADTSEPASPAHGYQRSQNTACDRADTPAQGFGWKTGKLLSLASAPLTMPPATTFH